MGLFRIICYNWLTSISSLVARGSYFVLRISYFVARRSRFVIYFFQGVLKKDVSLIRANMRIWLKKMNFLQFKKSVSVCMERDKKNLKKWIFALTPLRILLRSSAAGLSISHGFHRLHGFVSGESAESVLWAGLYDSHRKTLGWIKRPGFGWFRRSRNRYEQGLFRPACLEGCLAPGCFWGSW